MPLINTLPAAGLRLGQALVPPAFRRTGSLSLGRLGSLEVRLASTPAEVRAAQALRYRVFYEEMSAFPDARTLWRRRDADAFDRICDHLLVLDHDDLEARPFRKARPRVVGTYRLLRQEVAERHNGFYTAGEFDIEPLLARHRGLNFLELGRSCVMKPYRTKRTVELLWHGIWAYALRHDIDAMIGCASFEGTDPSRLALPLSFLHHHAAPDADWHVEALPGRGATMNRLPIEAVDMKAALASLPPLVKGYLRLGAMIGRGAVVDEQFGTVDVLVLLPVDRISERYVKYYGADASRYAT
jgi:putative hemolysin